MPQVVPIIIAAAAKAVTAAAAIKGIGLFLVSTLFSLAVQFIGKKKRRTSGGSSSFSSNPRQRGLTLSVRESDYPRRIIYGEARVGGIWFYVETTGDTNEFLHMVLGVCEGPIEGIQEIYFGDERLPLSANGVDANGVSKRRVLAGRYGSLVDVKMYDGTQTLADEELVANSVGLWTENHKLLNISYAYLRVQYDAEEFKNGLPEISFLVKGRKDIFDPRDDSTSYSNNAALCLTHYQTLDKMGIGADYATEINEESLIESANICDESILKSDGSTELRYTTNGVVFLDQKQEYKK